MDDLPAEKNYKNYSKEELEIELSKCYSTFKNDLFRVSLIESLCVVWAYFRNISKELNFVFPTDIQSHDRIISPDLDAQSIRLITNEWDLTVLAREIIINSPISGGNTLKDWKTFNRLFNQFKSLEKKIEKTFVDKDNILNLIKNMSNRQLKYQQWERPSEMYLEIFTKPLLKDDYIEKVYNMPAEKFFTVSFLLFASFMGHPIKIDSMFPQSESISKKDYLPILRKVSLPIEDIKKKLQEESLLNETFVMNQDVLSEYPLLSSSEGEDTFYICPIPYLFFWRIFGGVYYDIIRSECSASFSNDLGMSFQKYITNKTQISNKSNRLVVWEEQIYKKQGSESRTIDLRIEDTSANLFIECKAARPSQKALREITTNKKTKEDFDRFLEFIIQGYKTIGDYANGKYPEQKPTNIPNILLIVTMEDWHFEIFSLYFNVEEELKKKLKEYSLPVEYLTQYPYFTCSAYTYQYLLEIFKTEQIYDVLANKKNNLEYNKWGLEEYLRVAYSNIFAQTNP